MFMKAIADMYRKLRPKRSSDNNQLNRDKWVENALLKVPNGATILDAGAGEQRYKQLCERLHYISQDFSKYDGEGNSSGLQMGSWDTSDIQIVSDITSIPMEDSSLDAVMCTEVFEHLPNPVLALNEFSRLLKNGGFLILTAPFCSLTHFAPYHFYSGFNRYFYEYHLPQFGFKILELSSNGNYFDYMAQELRRLKHCSKSYANKKRMNFFTKLSKTIILRALNEMSKRDIGSNELLCFGYHVFAQKVVD